jgi:hypothetical protein
MEGAGVRRGAPMVSLLFCDRVAVRWVNENKEKYARLILDSSHRESFADVIISIVIDDNGVRRKQSS